MSQRVKVRLQQLPVSLSLLEILIHALRTSVHTSWGTCRRVYTIGKFRLRPSITSVHMSHNCMATANAHLTIDLTWPSEASTSELHPNSANYVHPYILQSEAMAADVAVDYMDRL